MNLLLRNVLVLDQNSPVHSKKVDLLIQDGYISSFSGGSAEKVLDLDGMCVSYGWFDLNAQFFDPGNEYREDVFSGSEAAGKGGFTDVCLSPDTTPPIDTKSSVSYLLTKAIKEMDIHVCATVSAGGVGENLTEMLDLFEAGAVAFSDGDNPLWNTELLLKALQYTKAVGVPIIQNARDIHLSKNTHMHEGITSTKLGLRGEPSLSEELMIQRDIEILKYSGGSLHFSRVSTSRGIELIRHAKKEGLDVTCDVGVHHLIFTDESIENFDTLFKSMPPYRVEADRQALINAVKDGTVDAICSNHRPYDQECKQLEFDLADPGNTSLQTFYPALLMISKEVPFERLLDCVVNGPRKILKKEQVKIDVGQEAKLTFFDPEMFWTLNEESNKSKSRNSPFWNKELKGKVVGTVNRECVDIENL